jgi:hypothetical protein
MQQNLTRKQSTLLGTAVLVLVLVGSWALFRIGSHQGLWASTTEVTVAFAEPHDITPGTPVRIRGVEAGHVVAIDYPDHDGPDAAVTLRMKIDSKFASRLYGDAFAQIHSTGLLGGKVIAIQPGDPNTGPLANGRLAAKPTPDLAVAAAKISDSADEAKRLIREVREGKGSLGKLVTDDTLFTELTGLATDARGMVKRADVALGKVEDKTQDVDKFVKDGRETLRSVRQGTDAVQKLPIIRGYVEDAAALMVRPDCRKEGVTYNTVDLFEPNTAILTEGGQKHLQNVATWLKALPNAKTEIVVAALSDPARTDLTPAAAAELTRKQSEAVTEHLRGQRAFRLSWISSRKVTPIGIGQGPSPVVETQPMPASWLQVLAFTPQ